SSRLIYTLLKKLYFIFNSSYTRKEYDNRIVTTGQEKQKDDLYVTGMTAKYRLNKNNSLSLNYTYRHNSSNEPFEEYTASIISCGWQHIF
ncbi:MAG: outer membrane beta-barrel protein, partial [Candidatus Omnitrophica bacterium]|nr:outer membrane beta-barrel protein [Candidatus Omnitrophota bacterium]